MVSSDSQIRRQWKEGSTVQIYSNSRKKWFEGEIISLFVDEEGEWLEVRYCSTMSKQVQRFSTDIRPVKSDKSNEGTDTDTSSLPPSSLNNSKFSSEEMKIRARWCKGNYVEIYSNTHRKWYRGEILELIKDDEGEWINIVWNRDSGEQMSKQVQRFSTDVRPVLSSLKKKKKNQTKNSSGKKSKRRFPKFSRSLPPSTHTFPATSGFRQNKKLKDIIEEDGEKIIPCSPLSTTRACKKAHKLSSDIMNRPKSAIVESWDSDDVMEWLSRLGKAYEQYGYYFQNCDGCDLIKLSEPMLINMNIPKLHRCKILLELKRYADADSARVLEQTKDVDVLNWNSKRVAQWVKSQPDSLNKYANLFEDNGIDGLLLFELDEQDLEDMNIPSNMRDQILKIIFAFAESLFPEDDSDDEATLSKRRQHKRRQSVQMLNSQSSDTDLNNDVVDLLQDMAKLMSQMADAYAEKLTQGASELERKVQCLVTKDASPREVFSSMANLLKLFGTSQSTLMQKTEEVYSKCLTFASQNGSGLEAIAEESNEPMGHKRRQTLVLNNEPLELIDDDDYDYDDISDDSDDELTFLD